MDQFQELCFPEQRISGDCFGLSRPESAVKVLVAQLYPVLFDPNATPWTVAHQSPVSMGFSRQEYWNGLPCPPQGDLPNPGIELRSPALQVDSLLSEPPGKPDSIYSFLLKRVNDSFFIAYINEQVIWLNSSYFRVLL